MARLGRAGLHESELVRQRTRIKICGITRIEDAMLAAESGADAVGLNFASAAKRRIAPEAAKAIVAALPPMVQTVGVFVDATSEYIRTVIAQTGIAMVQLHGSEPAEQVAELAPLPVLRAVPVRDTTTATWIEDHLAECWRAGRLPCGLLLDAYQPGVAGGTGRQWDWSLVERLEVSVPLILAGGLDPDNVAEAITAVRPFAVDVASGVESSPGIKNPDKLRAFIRAVNAADGRCEARQQS
jgi:phosphoribosylanthranilate isomerase